MPKLKAFFLVTTLLPSLTTSQPNLKVVYESKDGAISSKTFTFFPANFTLNWREAAELCENIPGAVLAKVADHESEVLMKFLLKKAANFPPSFFWVRNRQTISDALDKEKRDVTGRVTYSDKKMISLYGTGGETGVTLKCYLLHADLGLREELCDHRLFAGIVCVQKLKFKRPHKAKCPPSSLRPWIFWDQGKEANPELSSLISLGLCGPIGPLTQAICDPKKGWEVISSCSDNLSSEKTAYKHYENPYKGVEEQLSPQDEKGQKRVKPNEKIPLLRDLKTTSRRFANGRQKATKTLTRSNLLLLNSGDNSVKKGVNLDQYSEGPKAPIVDTLISEKLRRSKRSGKHSLNLIELIMHKLSEKRLGQTKGELNLSAPNRNSRSNGASLAVRDGNTERDSSTQREVIIKEALPILNTFPHSMADKSLENERESPTRVVMDSEEVTRERYPDYSESSLEENLGNDTQNGQSSLNQDEYEDEISKLAEEIADFINYEVEENMKNESSTFAGEIRVIEANNNVATEAFSSSSSVPFTEYSSTPSSHTLTSSANQERESPSESNINLDSTVTESISKELFNTFQPAITFIEERFQSPNITSSTKYFGDLKSSLDVPAAFNYSETINRTTNEDYTIPFDDKEIYIKISELGETLPDNRTLKQSDKMQSNRSIQINKTVLEDNYQVSQIMDSVVPEKQSTKINSVNHGLDDLRDYTTNTNYSYTTAAYSEGNPFYAGRTPSTKNKDHTKTYDQHQHSATESTSGDEKSKNTENENGNLDLLNRGNNIDNNNNNNNDDDNNNSSNNNNNLSTIDSLDNDEENPKNTDSFTEIRKIKPKNSAEIKTVYESPNSRIKLNKNSDFDEKIIATRTINEKELEESNRTNFFAGYILEKIFG